MGLFLGETINKNINGIFNDTALESASLTRFALKAK